MDTEIWDHTASFFSYISKNVIDIAKFWALLIVKVWLVRENYILFAANIRKNEWMVVLKVVWVNCGQSELRGDNKFETENISSFKKRTVGHFSAIFVVNFYILIRQGICVESRLSVLHLDIKTKHRH